MDDLPHLVSMLKAEPPPLTPEEQEILHKIKEALGKSTDDADAKIKERLNPPEFTSIPKPQPLTLPSSYQPEISTVFQTQNAITIGPNGQYPTISAALNDITEETTLLVEAGTYTDEATFVNPIHIVAQGEVQFAHSRFTVRTQLVTFRGFTFVSENETFIMNAGQLSFLGCKIVSQANKLPIEATTGVTLEFIQCTVTCAEFLQIRSSSSISFINSQVKGAISVSKSDMKIINSHFNGGTSPIALQIIETSCQIIGSVFVGSSSVAISAVQRSTVDMSDSFINRVSGAGILVHSFSVFKGKNIRISETDKAGFIVYDGNAEITRSSITNCSNSGCEILSSSSLELNEIWISETKGSAILVDQSKIKLTRCRVTNASKHGIEVLNSASAKISDTMIDTNAYSGILSISGKIELQSCHIEGNHDSNVIIDDRSFLEPTNCSFLKSEHDGLVADSQSMVKCNGCYFISNKGRGIVIKNCRDSKFQETTLFDNKRGGLLSEKTKQMVVDSCIIYKNSFIISEVQNAIVRKSAFFAAHSKLNNKREHIEIRNDSKATFEENKIEKCCTRVVQAELNARQNKFLHSPITAIEAEYKATLHIESNEFEKDHMILSVRDNSEVHCFNNKMTNISRPKTSDSDAKFKAIFIRSFSEGRIEGNTISGVYDYAIFIDGQSKVDNIANQIECGAKGSIYYSGVSTGNCEKNNVTGNHPRKDEYYGPGCGPTRR